MKRFTILLALLMFQVQVASFAATTKKPAAKTQSTKQVSQSKGIDGYTQDGSDYLLKYNIKDLEAAPWLNNGTRKPEN
jgi:hypothetical protein